MKCFKGIVILLLIFVQLACNNSEQNQPSSNHASSKKEQSNKATSGEPTTTNTPPKPRTYSNERFKDVTVERSKDHEFRIKGKARVFEASFSWIVEDGHEELYTGHQMSNAGAPEWGDFSFAIDVLKKRPNSTLTLILFESSPKDGSRQYELPIPLY